MPIHPTQHAAATLPCEGMVGVARFVAVGQAAPFGVKSFDVSGRITIGGHSARIVIRVGVALP